MASSSLILNVQKEERRLSERTLRLQSRFQADEMAVDYRLNPFAVVSYLPPNRIVSSMLWNFQIPGGCRL
jgi:hypothetical protein